MTKSNKLYSSDLLNNTVNTLEEDHGISLDFSDHAVHVGRLREALEKIQQLPGVKKNAQAALFLDMCVDKMNDARPTSTVASAKLYMELATIANFVGNIDNIIAKYEGYKRG
jgi:hypothetical protein